MNETINKFGYPNTLIKEYENWVLLIRPKQITIGSLVLICKENVENFPSVSSKSFSELKIITKEIEETLIKVFQMDKINYLALMMVDKNVHFHIVPRYSKALKFKNKEYKDIYWPGPYEIKKTLNLDDNQLEQIRFELKEKWINNEF